MLMDQPMMVNGNKVNVMEWELKCLKMGVYMLGRGQMVDLKLENAHTRIKFNMKVIGWRENHMDMEYGHGQTADNMKESGIWENHMETDSKFIQMEKRRKDSGEMENLLLMMNINPI